MCLKTVQEFGEGGLRTVRAGIDLLGWTASAEVAWQNARRKPHLLQSAIQPVDRKKLRGETD